MADVRLSIAGREYLVTCRDGEEERLRSLGAMVDEKAQEAGGSASGLNESRQLLFASLLLADKLADDSPRTSAQPAGLQTETRDSADVAAMEQAANTLEKLADRVEALADRLEQ